MGGDEQVHGPDNLTLLLQAPAGCCVEVGALVGVEGVFVEGGEDLF